MSQVTDEPSALRRGLRRTLIYFGLAVEPGDPEIPAAPSPWWVGAMGSAFLGFCLTSLAWDQRGPGLGLYSLIGFAIMVTLNGPWRGPAWLERAENAVACIVIVPVGLAVLFPDRVDVWIPIGIGAVLAALLAVAAARAANRHERSGAA